MSAQLAYLARQLNSPLVVRGDYDELGIAPLLPLIFQRLRQRQAGGGGGFRVGASDEEILGALMGAEDMDYELGALDDELDRIEGMEEEAYTSDGKEAIGASLTRIANKINRLRDKETRLIAKMDSVRLPFRKKAIQKRLDRIRKRIDRLEAKSAKKAEKFAVQTGGSPEAVMAAVEAGNAGNVHVLEAQIARASLSRDLGVGGVAWRSPPEGEENRLSFRDDTSGALVVPFQFPVAAAAAQIAVEMETDPKSYASFDVVGVDIDWKARQASADEMMLTFLITFLGVDGKTNLFYDTVDAGFGAQTVNNSLSNARTIAGLRDNPVLERTNKATMSIIIRQEVATTEVIDGKLTASLVVRRRTDTMVDRHSM